MQKIKKIQKLQNWPQVALPSVIFVFVSFSKYITFFLNFSFPFSFGEYLDTKIYSKHGIIASSTFHFWHICRKLQFLQLNLKWWLGWTNSKNLSAVTVYVPSVMSFDLQSEIKSWSIMWPGANSLKSSSHSGRKNWQRHLWSNLTLQRWTFPESMVTWLIA